ncbi:hypothetical protein [Mycolicibacterium frederiksbergense]|uniref:hypothetical protein n=1 Tax=Mycolicibacterium frederiksbergense TaxID=117567 RepID=UPI0024739C70|nr:hypothetical protein [Mycolicibacterium frederiksbergense]
MPLAPMVAAVGVVLSGVGAAPAAASTVVPLSNQIRACDFVKHLFVGGMGAGGGSGLADIGTQGSEVRAVVSLQSARPDTDYQVRLIQLPRSSAATCHPGDPGVAGAVLHTDASGTAAVTVTDALNSGATAAWVIVEGPPPPGQIRGEVYTSDFPAKL